MHDSFESYPDVPFRAGDLVRHLIEPPGFEGTVYTVAGIDNERYGWVKLREYANPVGYQGLQLVTDATEPSRTFPKELPDPSWNGSKIQTLQHDLPDGGIIRHHDDDDGRKFCSQCEVAPQETRAQRLRARRSEQATRSTRPRRKNALAPSEKHPDARYQQSLLF